MDNKNYSNSKNNNENNRKPNAEVQRRRREHGNNTPRGSDQSQQQQQQQQQQLQQQQQQQQQQLQQQSQRAGKQHNPTKGRSNADKRPRQRGAYNNGDSNSLSFSSSGTDLHGSNSTGLALALSSNGVGSKAKLAQVKYDLNSVCAAGSKKHNLNHLLNFHCTPRESNYNAGQYSVFRANSHGLGSNGNKTKKVQHFNKEQFLQANFQFVICASAKASVCASPDDLIDWELIEQINIQTIEEPQCPICLYPPVAAKMTRCGHVYCWLCILHYLSLSDKSWRKCPICYEAIHLKDLKSTAIIQQHDFTVGSTIVFRLMRRKKGCLFIEHFDGNTSSASDANVASSKPIAADCFPLVSQTDDASFSKLLIATHADVLEILNREERELLDSKDDDNPTYVFAEMALQLLGERRAKLAAIVVAAEQHNEEAAIAMAAQNAATDECIEMQRSPSESNCGSSACVKYHYFYQSEDGQNIFLHPLNVKMLSACYGALANAPLSIEGVIVEKEYYSMDEELRRKFTCLSHLPLTCEFVIVEVSMQQSLITDEVLCLFKDDVLMRKVKRQRRDKQERKREKKINELNDKQIGKLISSTAQLHLDSAAEFPTFGFDEPLPTTSRMVAATPPEPASPAKQSGVWGAALPKKESWPTLSAPALSHSNDAVYYQQLSTAGRTRSRTHTTSTRSSEGNGGNASGSEADANDISVAKLNVTWNDVLSEAISKKQSRLGAQTAEQCHDIATNSKNHNNNSNHSNNGSNKKHKKNKKMVPLFSTGMNFNK